MVDKTKVATILIPQYYPLSGTSSLKLISLKGYNDSIVKKFKVKTFQVVYFSLKTDFLIFFSNLKIEKNLKSLHEWINELKEHININYFDN
jgi:hypothetical protein